MNKSVARLGFSFSHHLGVVFLGHLYTTVMVALSGPVAMLMPLRITVGHMSTTFTLAIT